MKKIIFTEEFCQPENLFPFTLTRPIQDIRIGILTIREKWEQSLGLQSFDKEEGSYKSGSRTVDIGSALEDGPVYLVHGNIIPTAKLIRLVRKLKPGEFISVPNREALVFCISKKEIVDTNKIRVKKAIEYKGEFREIRYPWEIFQLNNWALQQDFELVTQGRRSQKIPISNKLVQAGNIFIEKGVQIEHCIINASDGPVYIGRNAKIMEGSMIRGPVSIGENAIVKMGTRIYGATTIGPHCVAGGEIKNSVFFAFSNKAHDGYIGDSVIGEWCNMGAGTSCSNLKNNGSPVMIWTLNGPVNAGNKCGVMMGDFTRTAINTSINTGTVTGVCAHVFGNGLTPKYIPSFSWGSDGVQRYEFEKAVKDIGTWMSFKGKEPGPDEKFFLKHIFEKY